MLKKKVATKVGQERIDEIRIEIKEIDLNILKMRDRKELLLKEMINIELSPFKIGDYVLAEVSNGKSTKECKCLLEYENSMVYTRPVKDNGELSGRHFYLSPFKYSELKKC